MERREAAADPDRGRGLVPADGSPRTQRVQVQGPTGGLAEGADRVEAVVDVGWELGERPRVDVLKLMRVDRSETVACRAGRVRGTRGRDRGATGAAATPPG
jgi:hypothetical protein